ncbi:Cytochrome P450 82A1 [Medicago truncatula]|uniref:Cytochrome P450 82A1 n=1 Tax=Medicago truncatula TaxID=3880 RepID=A0A396H9F3_MEDTR|nr:Cytochrome P450 82A1 [Medicago truncatula]
MTHTNPYKSKYGIGPFSTTIINQKMELVLNYLNITTIALISLISLFFFLFRLSKVSHTKNPPTIPGSWPILGHLPLMRNTQTPHKTLASLADRYGPIFTIKLGATHALVLNNWELAKECFTKNDIVVSSRPKPVAAEIMSYNQAFIGWAPYGAYWRQLRKIVTMEILSKHRVELLSHIRVSEVQSSIKELVNTWSHQSQASGQSEPLNDTKSSTNDYVSVELNKWFQQLTLNMKGVGSDDKVVGERDFMDAMLLVLNDKPIEMFDADTVIKATTMELIIGGSDTTAGTLTWAMSLLLKNPHVLKKAKEELNTQIGKENCVRESDVNKLVYLDAIIKETLRFYPPAPFSSPREFTEDCTIGGYHIKKGTRLMPNLWKIHRDSRVWSDPLEFKPERFLTTNKDVDLGGQNFELLPFGSGRRRCAGMSLGLHMLHYILANFLHSFDILNLSPESIDLTEVLEFTSTKVTPLEVLVKPCLSPKCYEIM